MKDLLCLIYVSERADKKGSPLRSSYSYRYNKCKCSNCKEYQKTTSKKYSFENKEKIIASKKEYYKNNKKQIRERQLVYEEKTKDKRAEYLKKYYEENKERVRIAKREYSRLHPELDRNKNRRKRAIKKQNGFEKYKESDVLSLYGTDCYLCNKPIDLSATRKCGDPGWENGLHIEHYIDIALGGPDTLDNVRPAHGICNLTKKPRQMV
jgi:DNA repair exonuclease SbcCD ATPase subunit